MGNIYWLLPPLFSLFLFPSFLFLSFLSSSMDKVKVLSLMLHAADISHPAKAWPLHYRWTHSLMEEFFRQVQWET